MMRVWLMALVLWGTCSSGYAQASAQTSPQAIEAQVKAAFLYKFGAYVAWPAQSFERTDSPFVIGVVGADTFADVLEQTTTGRNVNGRLIEVHRLKRGAPLTGVQIAFVMGSDTAALNETLSSTKGQSVLIVTESEHGLSAGSMINFVLEQDKVRFDIAPSSAEQNNLKISARLLGVARKVVGRSS